MMKFESTEVRNDYYKIKEEFYWDSYKYYGTMATIHVVKGIVHDILFKYYTIKENRAYKKYVHYRNKQW